MKPFGTESSPRCRRGKDIVKERAAWSDPHESGKETVGKDIKSSKIQASLSRSRSRTESHWSP